MPSNAIQRLAIRRARVELLVPSDHPEPELLRARFDAVAKRELLPVLARALGHTLGAARPGVWLVRRLDVAFDAAADWGDGALTGAWAAAAARELQDRVASGRSDEVLWFRDRAALVAHFAADLAGGRAWQRWPYERFAGLRALPTSAALRTAIVDSGSPGAVLAAIDPAALGGVVAALTPNDAARVLAALAEELDHAEAWIPIARAFADELADGGPIDGEAQLALRLCARTGRAGAAPGAAVVEAARAVARLAARVAQAAPDDAEGLLAAVRHGRPGADALAGAGAEPRATIADALAVRAGTAPSRPAAGAEPGVRHTVAGGAFLLLPLLDELPIDEATAGWPACDDSDAASMLRLLVLAQVLGGERAPVVWGDPLLRDVAGVGPRSHAGALAAWAASIPAATLRASSAALSAWALEAGAVSGETFSLARAPLGVGHDLVLLDGARGQWIAVGALGRRRSRRPAIWLSRAMPPFADAASPGLLYDEGLADLIDTRRWAWSRPLADAGGEPAGAATTALADVRARLPGLADDLSYLTLPRAWQLPAPFAAALAVWSQALLRAFAWRISGFTHAGLRYLHANFLDVRASVEDEPERRVVCIGRAPLHLMLGASGMARAHYRLRWGDDRPFALFPSS